MSLRLPTLRRLDRWLGLPLTWLLTRCRRLAGGSPPQAEAGGPRRVLFILLSEMGSLVLTAPAVAELQRRGNAEAWFVVTSLNAEALPLIGQPLERSFRLRTGALPALLLDLLRFVVWARRQRFAAAVDFEFFGRGSTLLAWLSGAPERVGFVDPSGRAPYRGQLNTREVDFDPGAHMAIQYRRLVAACLPDGLPQEAPDAPWLPPPVAVADLSGLLPGFDRHRQRLLLLNPNAGDLVPQRRWPVLRYAQLARAALDRYPDLVIAIIGGPADAATAAALAAEVASDRCLSVAGRLPLHQLPGLFAAARLLVTNDSGPAHFAAVARLPTLVLFGPETPQRFLPLGRAIPIHAARPCSPCIDPLGERLTRCRDNRCMQDIGVATVFRELRRVLDSAACALPDGARRRAS